jgi:hypothetical protein
MALGSTQPLTEMSTINFPAGKREPSLKADDLMAIHGLSVYKMWESRYLMTLWISAGLALQSCSRADVLKQKKKIQCGDHSRVMFYGHIT